MGQPLVSYSGSTGFFAPKRQKKKKRTAIHFPGNLLRHEVFFVRPILTRGGEGIISPPRLLKSESELQAELIARAPVWALCGDAPHEAARETSRRLAEYALTQRFCQLNPRGRVGNIVLDLDHEAGCIWPDAPQPTYTTINPQSGHQQPGYLLADPVAVGGKALQAPLRYLQDIRKGLTRELSGDPLYGGLVSRGPYHPDHLTRIVSGRIWTLGDLLRELPPMPGLSRRAATEAAEAADIEGRNCAAFEALRREAYRLHDQGVSGAALVRQVQHQAEALNRDTFAQHVAGPLSARELAGIVRSICKWTDANHRPTSKGGSARSRTHSRERGGALPVAEQLARRQAGQVQGAASRREANSARLRAAEVQLQAAGEVITAAKLATLARVSQPTALAYLRNSSQTGEME